MIQIYKNMITKEMCETLIQKFEDSKKTEFDIFEQVEFEDDPIVPDLLNVVDLMYNDYRQRHDPFEAMPQEKKIEAFRVKKYTPNKHSFPLHVDVGNAQNCTRFISFLFYLNDNEAGTKFYTPGSEFTSDAIQGNVVVFPPMWMFPHEGLMPTENSKYIMSTYYHYV